VAFDQATDLVDVGVGSMHRLNDIVVVLLNLILGLRVAVEEVHPVHDVIVVLSDFSFSLGLNLFKVFVSCHQF
jgi:hypothetical protein